MLGTEEAWEGNFEAVVRKEGSSQERAVRKLGHERKRAARAQGAFKEGRAL